MNTKVCAKCARELPLDMFSVRTMGVLGRAARCKECTKSIKKKRPSWRDCIIPSNGKEAGDVVTV